MSKKPKKPSRDDARDDISAWNTEGVLCLLRKVSEVRRGPSVAVFAPFETQEGRRRRGTASRCNFAADTGCQRRATRPGQLQGTLREHGEEREKERDARARQRR